LEIPRGGKLIRRGRKRQSLNAGRWRKKSQEGETTANPKGKRSRKNSETLGGSRGVKHEKTLTRGARKKPSYSQPGPEGEKTSNKPKCLVQNVLVRGDKEKNRAGVKL